MNIFFLDKNPELIAQYSIDSHVVKIPVEIAQMMTMAKILSEDSERKIGHMNHPMSLWVRYSTQNYNLAGEIGLELCKEYTRRYGKVCASEGKIKLLLSNPIRTNQCIATVPPLCMPENYQSDDVVESYRRYYIHDKVFRKDGKIMAKWKCCSRPSWFTDIYGVLS